MSSNLVRLTSQTGEIIEIPESAIANIEVIPAQQQQQIQYQQHQQYLTPARQRAMKDDRLAQRDLDLTRFVVNFSAVLAVVGLFSIVGAAALAMLLNAAKPIPQVIEGCRGLICFSGSQSVRNS